MTLCSLVLSDHSGNTTTTGIGLVYLLSASGTSVGGPQGASHITPIFVPNDLIRVCLISLTISLAAGLFHAWKASRL